MNIGEVAGVPGCRPRPIRYYEEIGLITSRRDANGYRSFARTTCTSLAFVARARALGFSDRRLPRIAASL